MQQWQMQEAIVHLDEVVTLAQQKGPQEIVLDGRSVAVVMSRVEFDRLTGTGASLLDFMQRSPLYGLDEIEFPRDTTPARCTTVLE